LVGQYKSEEAVKAKIIPINFHFDHCLDIFIGKALVKVIFVGKNFTISNEFGHSATKSFQRCRDTCGNYYN
jgi:hypothetical protein